MEVLAAMFSCDSCDRRLRGRSRFAMATAHKQPPPLHDFQVWSYHGQSGERRLPDFHLGPHETELSTLPRDLRNAIAQQSPTDRGEIRVGSKYQVASTRLITASHPSPPLSLPHHHRLNLSNVSHTRLSHACPRCTDRQRYRQWDRHSCDGKGCVFLPRGAVRNAI